MKGRRKNLRYDILSQRVQFDPYISGSTVWEPPKFSDYPTLDEKWGTCNFDLQQMETTLARWVAAGYTEVRIKSVWFDFWPKYGKIEMRSFQSNSAGSISNVEPPGAPQCIFYKPGAVNIDLSTSVIGTVVNPSEYLLENGGFKKTVFSKFKMSVPLTRWLQTSSGVTGSAFAQHYADLPVNVKNRWMSLQTQNASYGIRFKGFTWAMERFYKGSTDYNTTLAGLEPWRIVGHVRCDVRRPITFKVVAAEALASAESRRDALLAAVKEARLRQERAEIGLLRDRWRLERIAKDEEEREAMKGPFSQVTDMDTEESEEEEAVATK